MKQPVKARILRHAHLRVYLALALILTIGIYVRLENLPQWKKSNEIFFFNDEPLLTNLDGYYYLRLARDLATNTYEPLDELRTYPETPPRPNPPPLLSVLTAGLHKLTDFSLQWVAVLLPAFLGTLLAIPIYILCRQMQGSHFMGITASLASVLSVQYVYRTSCGYYDTDCLNLVFPVAAVCCFVQFAAKQGRQKYLYAAAGLLIYALFLWWWDTAPEAVTFLCLAPMIVALALSYRPPRKEALAFFLLLTLSLIAIFLACRLNLSEAGQRLSDAISTGLNMQVGLFPAAGSGIRELKVFGLNKYIDWTTGSVVTFVLSLLGFLWFLYKQRIRSLYLLPILFFASFIFFAVGRWVIFLAPVIAIGLGFAADTAWILLRRYNLKLPIVVVPVVVLLLLWPTFKNATFGVIHPLYKDRLPVISQVIQKTSDDSVIWTTWPLGYPLMFHSQRRVISDGKFMEGERLFYNYLPLVATDLRFSANFMRFYARHGMAGIREVYRAVGNEPPAGMELIKEVLSAGPEKARELLQAKLESSELRSTTDLKSIAQWQQFFFPPESRPIYLALHTRMTKWLGWFESGSWDLRKLQGVNPVLISYYDARVENGKIRTRGGLQLDREKGGTISISSVGGREYQRPLFRMGIYDGREKETVIYKKGKGLVFELFTPTRFAAFMDWDMAESVFNQLFIRHMGAPYFRPIATRTPSYSIWQVLADASDSGNVPTSPDTGRNQ